MPPSLPKYAQPPDPVQAGPVFWTVEPCVSLPEWADTTEHPMLQVSHLMHLGDPLPAYMAQTAGYKRIFDELLNQLADLNAHPTQTLDRVLLVNSVVLPRLLYRCKCYPLTNTQLQELSSAMERFVFAMSGLPSLVAKKTLYTHPSRGLGLGCLQILYPTRVLDSLHRNPLLDTLQVTSASHISPRALFSRTLSLLGPPPTSSMLPLTVSWRSRKALRGAIEIASVAGLVAYVVPNSGTPPDYIYTDGSRIGSPPASGASAVLRDGRIVLCRVPGNPNSYKAEVVGILLGYQFSPPYSTLRVDCKGAIAATTGTRLPVRQSRWVPQTRHSLLSKNQSLEWIEGHTGHVHQEKSDEFAKYGSTLPPPPDTAQTPWDVVYRSELMLPPHKVWTHDLIAQHSHDHFHPSTWYPLKFLRLAWHKWLFGLQSRRNYSHYASLWRDECPPRPCPHCHLRHNLSVHGVLAHCSPSHRLVHAWLSSWPEPALVARWRSTALHGDLRIAGRLAVPCSLFQHLLQSLGGSRAARRLISHYQKHAVDAVTLALADDFPTTSSKPNPFHSRDWLHSSRPV